jgi:hypothetical protein
MQKVLELKAVVANRYSAMAAYKEELVCKESIAANADAATVVALAVRNANAKRTVAVMESLPAILKTKDSFDELVPVAARMLMRELADVTKMTELSVEAVRFAVKASVEASAVLRTLRSEANVYIEALNVVLEARAECLHILSPAGAGADSMCAVALEPLLDVGCVVKNVPVADDACVAASVEMLKLLGCEMDAKDRSLDRLVAEDLSEAADKAVQLMQRLAEARERVSASTNEIEVMKRACDAESTCLARVMETMRVAMAESTRVAALEAEARAKLDCGSGKFRESLAEAEVATEAAAVSADKFAGDLPGWMAAIGSADGAGTEVVSSVSVVVQATASVLLLVKSAGDAVAALGDLQDWPIARADVACIGGVDETVSCECLR